MSDMAAHDYRPDVSTLLLSTSFALNGCVLVACLARRLGTLCCRTGSHALRRGSRRSYGARRGSGETYGARPAIESRHSQIQPLDTGRVPGGRKQEPAGKATRLGRSEIVADSILTVSFAIATAVFLFASHRGLHQLVDSASVCAISIVFAATAGRHVYRLFSQLASHPTTALPIHLLASASYGVIAFSGENYLLGIVGIVMETDVIVERACALLAVRRRLRVVVSACACVVCRVLLPLSFVGWTIFARRSLLQISAVSLTVYVANVMVFAVVNTWRCLRLAGTCRTTLREKVDSTYVVNVTHVVLVSKQALRSYLADKCGELASNGKVIPYLLESVASKKTNRQIGPPTPEQC